MKNFKFCDLAHTLPKRWWRVRGSKPLMLFSHILSKKKKKMSLNFDSREKIYTTTCFARRWELQHLYNSYFNSTKQPTNIKGKYYIHIDVLHNILSRNFTIIRNHVLIQIFLLECSQYTYLLCIQTQMLESFSRQLKISQLQ